MAEPDMKRNTDVPSTIAGFYFQVLIACCAVCRRGVEEVGIEMGADVVVIDHKKECRYIETKLHSKNFNRFSEDIKKTIYNFYNGYKKSEKISEMIFVTNVSAVRNDKELLEKWEQYRTKKENEAIVYIQKAVLKQSIKSNDECRNKYISFCEEKKTNLCKDKIDYEDVLIQDVFDNTFTCNYECYAVVNRECTYAEFIRKLKFIFLHKDKLELIEEIEAEIIKTIKNDYQSMIENEENRVLKDQEAEQIFNCLIKIFLDCIAENSQNRTKKSISVKEYKKFLVEFYKNGCLIESEEMFLFRQCLKRLSFAEKDFIEDLETKNEENQAVLKCYSEVKELFLNKMQEGRNIHFMRTFLLDKKTEEIGEAGIAMAELIRVLTIIVHQEKMSMQEIKMFFEDDFQNLEIVNRLCCCYKHVTGIKTKFKNVFRNLLCNICPAEIHEGQVIVAEGNFLRGGSPCEADELYPEVYNIAEVDENYKDFLLFRSVNYKCTDCIDLDRENYGKFWKGGGSLCKKIL